MNEAMKNMIKEMERMNSFQINDPLEDIRKKLLALEIPNPFDGIRQNMKALQMAMNPFNELQERMLTPQKEFSERMHLIEMADPLKEIKERMKALSFQDPFESIRQSLKNFPNYSEIYRTALNNSFPISTFEDAYREVLSRHAELDFEDFETQENQVLENIKSEIENSPKSPLSFEFYINLIMALMLFVHSQNLAQESEERLSLQIQTVYQVLLDQGTEENKTPLDNYYVVSRAVNLRNKPTTKRSNVITVLYPNQKARLVERKGKWIRVEYFNHFSGVHESGWCMKKYLEKIKFIGL